MSLEPQLNFNNSMEVNVDQVGIKGNILLTINHRDVIVFVILKSNTVT